MLCDVAELLKAVLGIFATTKSYAEMTDDRVPDLGEVVTPE